VSFVSLRLAGISFRMVGVEAYGWRHGCLWKAMAVWSLIGYSADVPMATRLHHMSMSGSLDLERSLIIEHSANKKPPSQAMLQIRQLTITRARSRAM
jgi:hypothetical protein